MPSTVEGSSCGHNDKEQARNTRRMPSQQNPPTCKLRRGQHANGRWCDRRLSPLKKKQETLCIGNRDLKRNIGQWQSCGKHFRSPVQGSNNTHKHYTQNDDSILIHIGCACKLRIIKGDQWLFCSRGTRSTGPHRDRYESSGSFMPVLGDSIFGNFCARIKRQPRAHPHIYTYKRVGRHWLRR